MNISSDGYGGRGEPEWPLPIGILQRHRGRMGCAEEPRTPAGSAHLAVLESTAADTEGNKEQSGGGGGRAGDEK